MVPDHNRCDGYDDCDDGCDERGCAELYEAARLQRQAIELHDKGRFAEALPLFRRTLAIRERALGPEHPNTAESLHNIAVSLVSLGDYEAARPLLERALAILEKTLGPEHPGTWTSLNNLASLLTGMGDHKAARPLFERALAIHEKVLGPEHHETASSLNNLAGLLRFMGDHKAARTLYEQALAICEKVLGPEHHKTASSLSNLAGLLQAMGDPKAARPLVERALAISEKVLGLEHPNTASSLAILAHVLRDMGDHKAARPLYERALAIHEKVFGPEHIRTAPYLISLADLLYEIGDHKAARPLFERALAICENVLGPEHPDTAQSLNYLASLFAAMGDPKAALPLFQRALDIEERRLAQLMSVGSEAQKRAFMNTLQGSTDNAISFHLRHPSPDGAVITLGLQTVLRRKARVLEATADQSAALRRRLNPEDRVVLDRFVEAKRLYATLSLSPPQDLAPQLLRERLDIAAAELTQLEQQLSRKSEAFVIETLPVTIEAVRKTLSPSSALIELIVYKPFDPKAQAGSRWGEPRYAAYILSAKGEPVGFDLGDADTIDKAAKALRLAIASRDPGLRVKARALYDVVFARLLTHVKGVSHLILSPDGELAQVPFEALVDAEGKWLVESFQTSYLTTGRDLIRLQKPKTSPSPPLLLADIDYDLNPPERTAAKLDTHAQTRSADRAMGELQWARLPGTALEARQLAPLPLFRNATLLDKHDATEAALRKATSPRILHIATHGFFLEDLPEPPPLDPHGLHSSQPHSTPQLENPLLRSGLALSGANQRNTRDGHDDGVLTALEAAELDLSGTELVVMSACETGIGESKRGEGVFGLQRALVLAGARTQVMSLWKVDDTATQALMVAYYQRLAKGEGRAEAMRQVRLALLDGKMAATDLASGTRSAIPVGSRNNNHFPDWTHPYYWASFIVSGETLPLSKVAAP